MLGFKLLELGYDRSLTGWHMGKPSSRERGLKNRRLGLAGNSCAVRLAARKIEKCCTGVLSIALIYASPTLASVVPVNESGEAAQAWQPTGVFEGLNAGLDDP